MYITELWEGIYKDQILSNYFDPSEINSQAFINSVQLNLGSGKVSKFELSSPHILKANLPEDIRECKKDYMPILK
jgi:hypothetical protein